MCQLHARRPDLQIGSLRGNVPTRLRKLEEGEYDAIVLAVAGLARLGLDGHIAEALAAEVSLPAVGQGALGIEIRDGDEATREWVRAALHHEGDAVRVTCERAFLAAVEGGCQAPLAGFAEYTSDGALRVRALIGTPDGKTMLHAERKGAPESASELGVSVARDLLDRGGRQILDALPPV